MEGPGPDADDSLWEVSSSTTSVNPGTVTGSCGSRDDPRVDVRGKDLSRGHELEDPGGRRRFLSSTDVSLYPISVSSYVSPRMFEYYNCLY